MRELRANVCLALVVAVGLGGGCKKDSKAREWQEAGRSADVIEANKKRAGSLEASPLMAHIPADTPYAFASFEPIPDAYWDKVLDTMGPAIQAALTDFQQQAGPDDALLELMFTEGRRLLTPEGRKQAGLTADARFAVYGLGVLPVIRFELADGAAFLAWVASLAKNAGAELPPPTRLGEAAYWSLPDMIAGVADDQLVIAFGPPPALLRATPVLFGGELPRATMKDGGKLRALIAEHGFGPHMVGFIDSEALVRLLGGGGEGLAQQLTGALVDAQPTGACRAELGRLSVSFPGMVFGYDEITGERASMSAVIQTSKLVNDELRRMQAKVPGLSSRFPQGPLLAVGVAADFERAKTFFEGLGDDLDRISAACGGGAAGDDALGGLDDGYDDGPDLGGPGVEGVRGGVVVIDDVVLEGGMPKRVEGYFVLAMDNPQQLLAQAAMLSPALASLKADGAFHDVELPYLGKAHVVADDRVLGLAMGGKARDRLARALKEEPEDAPFVVLSYDAGKMQKLQRELMGQMAPGQQMPGLEALQKAQEELLGQAIMAVALTDAGLAISMRMDMK